MLATIKAFFIAWKGMIIAFVAGIAFGAAASGTAAWKVQGALKDAKINIMVAAALEAVEERAKKDKAIRALKDEQTRLNADLAVARDAAKIVHYETVTEERIKYVTTDPNATDCGLSYNGLCFWNKAAAGGRLPETCTPQPTLDASAIAASNAAIAASAELSFKRHWDAINQVEDLQNYIVVECLGEVPDP